ncbi:hypothetical protein Arnit_1096 [Arcobacter nitrofigilis DSM 7299]|uniref:DNA repair protein Rad50 n=1 Tax=Arcobacter nitrofigilis (strain ATCC 33309 / DSM 7299 / CCUG 15893 / LMG 7604 / NCTC 12251 / CI) TaxID=572480 RepID=D5V3T0_ARCNC|nr:hypothetical protein [Arcobacter nitrofigilis]ADG92758.1 hypothetical protein Arnit_1096 [Arcobacter nitrofigilis DSM 7299]
MSNIKDELKEVVEVTMLPEVERYLEDLLILLENNEATEDDMEAIKEMESFMVELQNIVESINTNQINDTQASEVYDKIMTLIDEHKEH